MGAVRSEAVWTSLDWSDETTPAGLRSIVFTNSIGCGAIEVESDALEVIQYCTGEERMWNEATAIYANFLSIAGSIGKVDFVHCLRDCNKAAHSIARYCFNSKISCNWVDDPPSFIAQTLIDDVTII
jgi:hypothetical protein